MLNMKLKAMKGMFFDQPAVERAIDRGTKQVLSKFGAHVRRSARSSIRTRNKVSSPGSPPSNRTRLLKNNILFGFEQAKRSVVVGPIALNQKNQGARALEDGGPSRVMSGRGRRRVLRVVKIRARPFMGPALRKEQPKLPAMWANSIK